MDYDIAIIVLDTAIIFSDVAKSISLSSPSEGLAVATGWGLTTMGGTFSDQLRATQVRIVQCTTDVYNFPIPLTNRMMCAVPPNSAVYQGTCQGDSGGPIVEFSSGRPVQVGIVSFGVLDCGKPNVAEVYTKVGNLFNWIRANIY